MPKMRILSGMEIVRFFERFGFVIVSQKGSHIKLIRKHFLGMQPIMVPNHRTIKKGTQKSIINLAVRYSLGRESKDFFYTKN